MRVLHAELERIANHLDVAVRLADAAGLAVATARFALHKERVQRLVSALCGSRFGRGVVVPGGVAALPLLPPAQIRTETDKLSRAVTADAGRADGHLLVPGPAARHRAADPGAGPPARRARPDRRRRPGTPTTPGSPAPTTDTRSLTLPPAPAHTAGDALARLRVRWEEVDQAFGLIRQAAEESGRTDRRSRSAPLRARRGRAVGWAEAPQGEVLYDVELADGRIARCQPRSASFHNLVLMHEVFTGDILTDFPFIEASFGLSVAGVAL